MLPIARDPARPRVRVNQLGYVPGRPMRATVVTDADRPMEFELRDVDGTTVFTGRSSPWPERPEPTSGLSVHVLDFTGAPGRGPGHVLHADGTCSHPFTIGRTLYGGLAVDSLRFFYLLRSGVAISGDLAPGYERPAGHVGRPPNRGDVEVPAWQGADAARLYPGWRDEGRYDVSGGWYDAGDYGKYVTSGGIAVWQLLSTLDLPLAGEPDLDVLVERLREECRWELDWMMRMQVPTGHPLAGMAFHRVHGTEWSPVPGWAHDDPSTRVLHRPSTSATLHLAAVAARGARLFRSTDEAYADQLLTASRRAHEAAVRHPQLLAPDDHARFGGGPYGDDDPDDDLYWANAELWLATGESAFVDELERSVQHHADVFDPAGFDFDRVAGPARLDLALLGAGLSGHDRVCATVRAAADRLVELQRHQPWGQPYAPSEGWDWGSNGRILNNLVVLAGAHRLTGDQRYRDAVFDAVDYLLGRNALGQSYVTGYGTDFSRRQRTRQFGHDLDSAFPPPPPGALAGGPNSRPHPDFPYDPGLVGLPPQCCYLDEPNSEVTNDVCIRWNAPLVFLAAYLQLNSSAET